MKPSMTVQELEWQERVILACRERGILLSNTVSCSTYDRVGPFNRTCMREALLGRNWEYFEKIGEAWGPRHVR